MVFDPLSPIAPARARVLILPLGRIRRDRFLTFIARLYPENVVRLGDISPDRRPNRNMFSPLAFQAGMIVYDLTTSLPPASHLALAPFELYREPLVILGIGDGSELDHVSNKDAAGNETNGYDYQTHLRQLREVDQELESVRDQYPKALVHQALLFDYHDDSTSPKLPDGLVPVPSLAESTITTMKTVMCDLSSLLLAEMTTMAKSFQGMAIIESPNKGLGRRQNSAYSWESATSQGLSRPVSQYGTPEIDSRTGSSLPPKADRSQVRMSMPVRFGSQHGEHFGAASTSRPATPNSGPGTPVDDPSTTKSPPSLSRENSVAEKFREHSRDRISVQGFGSGSLSERSRNKAKGRIAVAIGGLYLQAGRWQDALKELSEGAQIARTNTDHLWHAKALDGMLVGMLMLAWAGLDFQVPPLCYTSSDKAPYHTPTGTALEQQNAGISNRLVSLQNLMTLLPELLDRILGLYERASNFSGESLPQLPYSESAIRFSKLLSAAHLAGGKLDDNSLQYVVLGTPFPKPPNTHTPRLNIQPTRSVIVSTLFRAFPSSAVAAELSVIDRTIILAGIASVLGVLGYDRKKAMVMRELVSVLIPGLVKARMAGAAEMGIHPAAGLAALSHLNGNTNGAGTLDLGEGDVEAGMDDLLGLIGRIYGVVSFHHSEKDESNRLNKLVFDDSDETVVARIMENAAARQFGGKSLKMNVLRACINLAEALPDFQGVLRFSADLLRTAGTGVAPGPRRENAGPLMTRDEQVRLSTNIIRTVDAARKIGLQDLEAEYWDEFLVRGVELEPLAPSRTPNPHRSSELGESVTGAEAGKNPFIYNPFAKRPDAAAVERLVVSGESAIFKVTLQNPYEFDIIIDSIHLEGDGGEFESAVQETVVGPYRTQILSVSGTPKGAGSFKITGCIVKVRGCRKRRFPIFSEPWSPQSEIKIKAVGLAVPRRRKARPISDVSISKRPTVKPNIPKPATLSLTAIAPQPIVIITSNTLSQAATMVLEGERQTFSITLKNLSTTTPVDFLLFSFQDSTQGPLQTALSNRDASPAELYEYELILARKAALRYIKHDGEDETHIPPNGTKDFDFEILGKPGLMTASVLVDYAYLGKPASDVQGNFYTRQVSLPITVTVNAGIELSRIDILPLGGDVPCHLWPMNPASDDTTIDPRDYCLLMLDLRNAWPAPLRVSLEISHGRRIEEEILPGSTSRIVFPHKRIFLPDPYKAIPTLDPARQRQFVVSSGRISADSERASREAFWYREEILKSLHGTWATMSGIQRTGDIELRGMRLMPRMIEAIKIEDIGISLRVDGAPETRKPRTIVNVDDFLHVVVTITNRTSKPIYPLLRLQPCLRNSAHAHSLDLSKKIVWDGTLQRTLPLLPGHQSVDVRVTMTALCRGEFEIGASVEETRLWGEADKESTDFGSREKVGRQRANTGAMMDALLGVKERRVWYAREGLVLGVVDGDEGSDENDDE